MILIRALSLLPFLFCVTVLVFALMRLAPGDAAYMQLMEYGFDVTSENLAIARENLGLNRPIWMQYILWLGRILHGDFGVSAITRRSVLPEFISHLKYTATLAIPTLCFVAVTAIPAGILSAVHHRRLLDNISRVMTILFLSIPGFCLGLSGMLLFSVKLKWLPTFGASSIRHFILPWITITIGNAAGYARFVRGAILDELSRDYIRSARSRGVSTRTLVWGNVLKNAAPPIVTSLGMTLGLMLGGSAVIEKVFSIPGVGKFLIDAIMARDYAIVQCCAVMIAVFFVTVNLCSDLICMVIDPRIRRAGRRVK